ncbi:related to protein mediates microtubule-dependent mRNA transport [Pseudozyma flocculosa]|uniref:Related to protein mediates microtubule-dependent mRNA transport n=1 Tax=Pseudozyma flocculosa TaxID=84751 RepID=A0A5C3F7Y4_9BASI|nr:related to protein mediates microtubule-dependent mRNA transport [Pseudozyma flocculosa]
MSDSIYAPHNQHKLEAARAQDAAAAAAAAAASSSSNATGDAEHATDADAKAEHQPPTHDGGPDANDQRRPPNPHLTTPLLYISGIDPKVSDRELASGIFEKVLPVRLKINRDVPDGQTASGTVEFQTIDKAEKAYATVRPPIRLRIVDEGQGQEPRAASKPRLVKQLPPHTDDAMVYDMFRPFGPLVRAHCILTSPAGVHTGFRGMASLEYYSEQDAQLAQDEMHCVSIGDKTISVAVDSVQRRPTGNAGAGAEFNAAAAPFVPGGRSMNAAAPSFAPSASVSSSSASASANRNVSGGSAASIYATGGGSRNGHSASNGQETGPLFPVPGSNLQYSAAAATYIDPCNLFCKNLDPAIDSNELFSAFKGFGRIVSARVMRDNEGKSREFGFVSFTTADEAQRALRAMHNTTLGAKQITVRLHEPKKMRQEKLAAKFGGSGGGNGAGTGGSATPNSDYGGMRSPSINGGVGGAVGAGSMGDGGGVSPDERQERRMSNSYYKAALANSDGGAMDEAQLSSLTPVVRREVLSGEFSRRVRELPGIGGAKQADAIVAELVHLTLADAVEALNSPTALVQRVGEVRERLPQTTSPGAGPVPSGMLGVPGIQRSFSSASSTADHASAMSSAPASSKERERLLRAVISVAPAGAPVEDITDMLVTLPKKERALCLFNPEVLRAKVEDAREILDMTEDEEIGGGGSDAPASAAAAASSSSPKSDKAVKSEPAVIGSGSNTNGTDAAPATTTTTTTTTYTLATLAELPAAEIIKLANSTQGPASSGLPLPKADPKVVQQTDEFIDSLAGKAPHDQKQKLGDQLFKKVRGFGVKGAPKITIALLDSEDLRALAHLMNSYEAVLREKVLQRAAAATK